jgi:TatD DNase family protein
LSSLPPFLAALYGPATVKPEKFVEGKAVKGRNEPCSIGQVAWVVAQVKGVSIEEVCEAAYRNTKALFRLGEGGVDA